MRRLSLQTLLILTLAVLTLCFALQGSFSLYNASRLVALQKQLATEQLPSSRLLGDIRARDERDSGRGIAPLKQAEDAALLDTSALDVEGAVATAIGLVEQHRKA